MEQEKEQDLKLITTYIPRTFNYQKGRREKQQIKKFEIHEEVQRLKRESEELV